MSTSLFLFWNDCLNLACFVSVRDEHSRIADVLQLASHSGDIYVSYNDDPLILRQGGVMAKLGRVLQH